MKVQLQKQKLIGWKLREVDYEKEVGKYLNRLDAVQSGSFAPLSKLIEQSLEGFDLHVMAWVTQGD